MVIEQLGLHLRIEPMVANNFGMMPEDLSNEPTVFAKYMQFQEIKIRVKEGKRSKVEKVHKYVPSRAACKHAQHLVRSQ